MEFSRQEYWSRLLFPTPRDLPDPGIEPVSVASPALAGGLFPLAPPTWKALLNVYKYPQPLQSVQLFATPWT